MESATARRMAYLSHPLYLPTTLGDQPATRTHPVDMDDSKYELKESVLGNGHTSHSDVSRPCRVNQMPWIPSSYICTRYESGVIREAQFAKTAVQESIEDECTC